MALTTEQKNAILQMTQAMFNATPGTTYFNALGSQLESGQTISDIAQSLAGMALFLGKDYSSLASPEEFGSAFIEDLVGDNASAANKTLATDYVVSRMNEGASQDQMIAEITGILTAIPSTDTTWGKAALQYNTHNVDTLVDNLLGDTVDTGNKQAASTMILEQMATGATFGEMVQWAITTLDNIDHTYPVWGNAATLFDNRIDVSNYYTLQKQGHATDVATLTQLLVGVGTSAASVTAAKAKIDELLPSNAPVIDLAQLNGSNGFTLINDLQFDNVTNMEILDSKGAGDINGDGVGDIVIGTQGSFQIGGNFDDPY